MKNIIEIYNEWPEYQKTIGYRDVVYYETIFKCAKKRKGIVMNPTLLKEYSKNNHYKHENKVIMEHIHTIPFQIDFDIFEMQSRVLCDYLKEKNNM
jgi:hypothetical protein